VTRLTALAGIVGISFAAIFVRLADATPSTVAFFRTLYALPFLIVIARLSGPAVRPRSERLMAFGAGMLLAVDLTLWHTAIDLIGAGLATVLANVQVVWVGLVAWVLFSEKPSRVGFAVVPVVLGGVVMISGLGQDDAFGEDPVLGTLVGLTAGVVYASFLLLFRHSNRSRGRPAAPLLDATAGAVVGAALIGLFDSGFSLEVSWPSHGWLLALAVVAQTLGWLFISVALPRLAALETSVMLLLQPALTIVWARVLFTEDLSPLQWAGVAVVMAGVLFAGVRGSVATPVAPVAPDP
jgi:drug/metabolite transporter (DMT)-like permease